MDSINIKLLNYVTGNPLLEHNITCALISSLICSLITILSPYLYNFLKNSFIYEELKRKIKLIVYDF